MTVLRQAVSALALSLSLTAAGAFSVVAAVPTADASESGPVGGPRLAGRGVIVDLGPGVPRPPAMPGASFLLADMDTGQILVAKAPHARRLPASTMKTLTALTLIPVLDPNSRITVTAQDVRPEGSRLGILAGTSYSVATLMQGMLMASGNDAAYALARGNGSVSETLKAMNATAAHLNAFDTVAKDPSGLDKPGQSSSAYDLALIGRAAMKLPDFRQYVLRKRVALGVGRTADGRLTPGIKVNSHNTLLYNYPGAIGVKSGFTIAAKQTYIGAATRAGKTYIVTQMGSVNGSWRPTAALLDWAFANGAALTPVGQLVEPGIAATAEPTVAPAADTPMSPGKQAPAESALLPTFPAWGSLAVLFGALALGVGWRRRYITRRRLARMHSSSTRR